MHGGTQQGRGWASGTADRGMDPRRGGWGRSQSGRGRGDGSWGRGRSRASPANESMHSQGPSYPCSIQSPAASSGGGHPVSRVYNVHMFLKLVSWSNQHQMRRFIQAALAEPDVANLALQLGSDSSAGRNLIRGICEQAVCTGGAVSTETGKRAQPVSFQAVIAPLLYLLSKPEFFNCPVSDAVNSIYAAVNSVKGFTDYILDCLEFITQKWKVKDDVLYQDCQDAQVAWLPATWEDVFLPVIMFKSQILPRFWESQNSESELQFTNRLNDLVNTWTGSGDVSDCRSHSNRTREVMKGSERLLRLVNGTLQQKLRREAREREKQRQDMLFPSEAQSIRVAGCGRIEINGPGELSYSGEPRHNNDHVRITDISIAPTPDEVLCVQQPYLPKNDPNGISLHHEKDRPVIRQLDIHFRLLRYDLVAPLRERVLLFSSLKEEQRLNLRRGRLIFDKYVRAAATSGGQSSDDIDIFMFQNVTVKTVVANRGTGISYMVEFDDILPSSMSAKEREMFWDRSKRLQHGSLVCLWRAEKSAENGGQEAVRPPPVLLFGTISIRDIKHLANPSAGRIHVGMSMCGNQPFSGTAMQMLAAAVNGKNVSSAQHGEKRARGKKAASAKGSSSGQNVGTENEGSFKSGIVLLEAASNYFAYEPVLKALQTHNELTVPFADYICGTAEGAEIPLPAYINQNTRYDLKPLVSLPGGEVQKGPVEGVDGASPHSKHHKGLSELLEMAHLGVIAGPAAQVDLKSVPMDKPASFPVDQLAAKSTLDRAQAEALKAALMQEIVLIQGPPGTGKTFLGVKLIHMLLHNTTRHNVADSAKPFVGPILCVCFTNHALDQFLEGILSQGVKKVVRVGQRSRNESLIPYNLQEILKRDVDARKSTLEQRREEYHIMKTLEALEAEISHNKFAKVGQNWESVKEYLAIFYPDQFESLMSDGGSKHEEDGSDWHVSRPRLSEDDIWSNWLKGFPSRDGFKASQWLKLANKQGVEEKVGYKTGKEGDNGFGMHQLTNMFSALNVVTGWDTLEELEVSDLKDIGDGVLGTPGWVDGGTSGGLFQSHAGACTSTQRAKGPGKKQAAVRLEMEHSATLVSDNTVSHPERPIEELLNVRDVWSLSPSERTKLLDHWTEAIRKADLEKLEDDMRTYVKMRDRLNSIREMKDLSVLRNADVVGMTTSGVAKSLRLVTALGPRIVVVEEAAEVLESHILSCLSAATQHLVLIGDHLQLRPKVEVYELSKDSQKGYNLDVSLFERLVKHGKFPFYTLEEQRRMRPCIADLVRKTIYPKLRDHSSVKAYPPVKGMVHDIYFWDHDHPEAGQDENLGQSRSKLNDSEAYMVAGIAKYLFSQGYKPDEITILTPYLGQLQKLRSVLSKVMYVHVDERDEEELLDADLNPEAEAQRAGKTLKSSEGKTYLADGPVISTKPLRESIRIATVDNFQGEESTIVILSLVRNNRNGKIGFLNSANRINVMLSRAKHGLYLVGNAESLTSSRNSKMWPKVLDMLKEGKMGKKLPLKCEQHPERITHIERAQDFEELVGDGGCSLLCGFRLPCGHQCPRRCHPDNRNHAGVRCLKPCQRLRPASECKHQHTCRKVCGDVCGPCVVPVGPLVLPCGHTARDIPCWKTLKLDQVPCGVMVEVEMVLCGHILKVQCWQREWTRARPLLCREKCKMPLPCGHNCSADCGNCLTFTLRQRLTSMGDRRDTNALSEVDPSSVVVPTRYELPRRTDNDIRHCQCNSTCLRPLSCGHPCESACHAADGDRKCKPCSKTCAVRCVHSRCSLPCDKLCAPCAEPCVWTCSHGYGTCQMPCSAPCDRLPCDRRCDKILSCGHRCPSICGEICPSKNYCSSCAPAQRKQQVVDLIMFTTLEDHDPSDDPLIVLPCQHAFTISSLDGVLEFETAYARGPDGKWVRAYPLDQEFTRLKGCPECRRPITSVFRYGRLTNKAFVDQAERKFVQQSNMQHGVLESHFHDTHARILSLIQVRSLRTYPLSEEGADLLVSCMRRLKVIGSQFELLLKACKQPPTMTVYNASVVAMKRKAESKGFVFEGESSSSLLDAATQLPVPKPDSKAELCAQISLGDVLGLSMSVEYFWVPHAMEVAKRSTQNQALREQVSNTELQSVWIEVVKHLEMADRLFEAAQSSYTIAGGTAKDTKNIRTESLAKIKLAELQIRRAKDKAAELSTWGFPGALPMLSHEQQVNWTLFLKKIEKDRLSLLDKATSILQQVMLSSLPSLQQLRDDAQKLLTAEIPALRKEIVNNVSRIEREQVIRAVRAEIPTGGAWYYCENGHPYVIGECGMPMQEATCPECGGRIGGHSHNFSGRNRAADDINRVAAQR